MSGLVFGPYILELWLRIAVLRAGGELIIALDDPDLLASDDIQLFAEAVNDGEGVRLTTARVGDERAGHA